MKYRVSIIRTATCIVEAGSVREAVEEANSDEARERTATYRTHIVGLCPDCGEPLTNRSMAAPSIDEPEENTYCDTCDSETGGVN